MTTNSDPGLAAGRLNALLLPAVQFLALPLYWLIGSRLLGFGPAAAAGFAAIAPFATHTAVLGIGFVVSYHNQHALAGHRHGPRRDWLYAFFREAGVSIRQFYWLMPFRAQFHLPDPIVPSGLPPIVLVHGYGCNRGLWLPAARWFSRRGYPVRAVNLVPVHGSIDDYAPFIAQVIDQVKADTGAGRVALIGHSMGGLVARAYLRHCSRTRRDPSLAALITLGTPHRGTHIACLGRGTNARQMRFGADWIVSLIRHEHEAGWPAADTALRDRITTITSLQDNIVSRPFEQRLPASRSIVVRRQGHMSLATSPRVFAVIDRLLRRVAAGNRG